MNKGFLIPAWPKPDNIHCCIITRLSDRDALQKKIGEHIELQYLKQVHGTQVFDFNKSVSENPVEADAAYSNQIGKACAVLTADCLPVFFCDENGSEIAVAHAGWRGLAAGVLENTLAKFKAEPQHILTFLGPAIGACHFKVGGEVRDIFIAKSDASIRQEVSESFSPLADEGKWMANIFSLARARLKVLGLSKIVSSEICTYCSEKDNEFEFYSYRRNQTTNRLTSIIWKS